LVMPPLQGSHCPSPHHDPRSQSSCVTHSDSGGAPPPPVTAALAPVVTATAGLPPAALPPTVLTVAPASELAPTPPVEVVPVAAPG